MQHYQIRLFLFFIFLLCAFTLNAQPKAQPPKLIVGIVIDGMRPDYITRFREKFSSHGFRKLTDQGIEFKLARYEHFFVEGSGSLASISTGTQPSVHGIIGNSWYDSEKHTVVESVSDIAGSQISPASTLLSTTFGDEAIMSSLGKSKVVSISPTRSASVLLAGHISSLAFYLDEKNGCWTNSMNPSQLKNDWVNVFNNKKLPDFYLSRYWNTLNPIGHYSESLSDTLWYEKGFDGHKYVFPYNLLEIRENNPSYHLLNQTPFGNTFCFDFASESIVNEKLGKDEFCDFLLLNFTACASVADRFSPLSVETEDAWLRLDNDLGNFIRFVEESLGAGNVLFFLTSDRAGDYPSEYYKANNFPSDIFNVDRSMLLLRGYLNAVLGPGDWVERYHNQQIYLDSEFISKSTISIEQVELKIATLMAQFSGCSFAIATSSLSSSSHNLEVLNRLKNNYFPGRSGQVIMGFAPGWEIQETGRIPAVGSSLIPNSVPLFFYGLKLKPKQVFRLVSPTAIAPTLSTLLGIPAPSGSSEAVLYEVLE